MSYRKWILVSSALFIIGLILGLLIPPDNAGFLLIQAESLGEMAQAMTPLSPAVLFIFIFVKNISVVVISLVFSPIFCLVPLFTLVTNGGLIGLLSQFLVDETSLPFLLVGLLPHGILELPALIMGEAATFSFGAAVVQAVFSKGKRDSILPVFRNNLKYLIISAVMFLVAAVIETWITPMLLARMI